MREGQRRRAARLECSEVGRATEVATPFDRSQRKRAADGAGLFRKQCGLRQRRVVGNTLPWSPKSVSNISTWTQCGKSWSHSVSHASARGSGVEWSLI